MKALTIKQPWASLIMSGAKKIENRSWAPPATLIDQRLVIHAGLAWDSDVELADDFDGGFTEQSSPRGVALGTVRVVAVVTESDDPYFFGPFGWILEDPQPFDAPVPSRGSLGLWRWD